MLERASVIWTCLARRRYTRTKNAPGRRATVRGVLDSHSFWCNQNVLETIKYWNVISVANRFDFYVRFKSISAIKSRWLSTHRMKIVNWIKRKEKKFVKIRRSCYMIPTMLEAKGQNWHYDSKMRYLPKSQNVKTIDWRCVGFTNIKQL